MKTITQFLTHQVCANRTPSVQYAFFDVSDTLFEFRCGLKDIAAPQAVHAHTTYQLFSITKTFTALAVMQLAEAGKLNVRKPVADYFPDFPYDRVITIEQLLSHTAGVPNPMPLRWTHLEKEHDQFQHDAFFKAVFARHPNLVFEPGTRFRYSNLGFVLLGQLIEKISGESYEDYVTRNIFRKCGIENGELRFTMDPSTHATGYHPWFSVSNAALSWLIDKPRYMGPREGRWKPFNRFYNNGKAYGGVIGSGKGLMRYAQTLMSDNTVLLGDKFKELLFAEKIIGTHRTGMACAWFTGELKGNRYVAHAGGGGGYYAELRVYPELKAGSYIVFNRSGMKDERMLDQTDRYFLTRNPV